MEGNFFFITFFVYLCHFKKKKKLIKQCLFFLFNSIERWINRDLYCSLCDLTPVFFVMELLCVFQGPKMKQFMDVFSIPEMTLLASVNEYFISNDIEYDPEHLYKDVSVSVHPLSTISHQIVYVNIIIYISII